MYRISASDTDSIDSAILCGDQPSFRQELRLGIQRRGVLAAGRLHLLTLPDPCRAWICDRNVRAIQSLRGRLKRTDVTLA
jgi:hypothetical protein